MVRTNMEVAMWTGVVGFRKEMDGAEWPALDVRTVLRSLDGSEATLAGVSSSLLSFFPNIPCLLSGLLIPSGDCRFRGQSPVSLPRPGLENPAQQCL